MPETRDHPAVAMGATVDMGRCSIPPPVYNAESEAQRDGWYEGYKDAIRDIRRGALSPALNQSREVQ